MRMRKDITGEDTEMMARQEHADPDNKINASSLKNHAIKH